MTAPTITYGHGFLTDCDDTTGWAETESGLPATLTVNDGDVFEIEGTCDNVADEFAYYEYDMTNISSDTYPKITIRYKTSDASNALGAKVVLIFVGGGAGSQTVLSTSFSTSWTETTVAITAGETIDKIQIHAQDNPDAVDAGTFQVYFDFIMIHKGTFTFPDVSDVENLTLENRYADIEIPGRSGDVTQFLGSHSYPFMVRGDMDNWGTWGSGSGATQTFGEYLKDIFDNADSEPFQWFTSDLIDMKVTCRKLDLFKAAKSKTARRFELLLHRYSLSDYDADSWA